MSFDRLAPHYGWMETVLAGPRLQACRTAWLGELDGCRRVLLAGAGHGRILRPLLHRYPLVSVTCVDASARMLAAARTHATAAGLDPARLEFVQARLPDWTPPPANFDVIVTNFFLDCFPAAELRSVIASLATAAAPGARWLVADFALPPRGPARWRAQAVHALMYAFFRLTTRLPAHQLTPPDALLAAHGFRLHRRRTSEWGLLQADCWQRDAA